MASETTPLGPPSTSIQLPDVVFSSRPLSTSPVSIPYSQTTNASWKVSPSSTLAPPSSPHLLVTSDFPPIAASCLPMRVTHDISQKLEALFTHVSSMLPPPSMLRISPIVSPHVAVERFSLQRNASFALSIPSVLPSPSPDAVSNSPPFLPFT
ncbi:hypothetical protein Nepgr_018825 [Nepenthes gracilis]|uniref:Uncharacterized protein n=1 Tax=Nepenthes gracilis TaxID=150966 RepID=A0AAD3SUJ7_NEPGR|nr:hypothetical protein Nepgr_018825 [Nepenthes gracilis]